MNFARIILFAIFICCALSAQAQLSANQGIGAFSFGGGGELLSPQAQKIHDETVRKNANARILKGHIFRRINGQIVNFHENGETIYGQMDTVSDGITILARLPLLETIVDWEG
ncbi:MAG TPA: hypothetical protein VMV89_13405 [Candidatus Paceibacterota bacterium]|nr:hypothetical protein [Candidatus Paceibacterota bacterium]